MANAFVHLARIIGICMTATGFLMWIWGLEAFGMGLFFINAAALCATTILLFLTSIEMFMARIEFYTMALLVMPLLPFMITSKFSFLSDKAIGLVINLSIKVCAISFITAFIIPFLDQYQSKFLEVDGVWESTGVFLQMLLASLIIYKLTKSISNIVQGLMSGSPSLGGSMMTEQAKSAAGTALAATGNVVGARSAAGGVMKKGFLANIGKGAVKSTGAYQHYLRGKSLNYTPAESSTQDVENRHRIVDIFQNKNK